MRGATYHAAFCFVVTAISPIAGSIAQAHDGPEHVVEALTTEMAAEGVTSDRLYRRACEYRALRKYAEAASDLEAALARDADCTAARFELTRLRLQQGDARAAEQLLTPLIESPDVRLRSAALASRGEVRMATGDDAAAAADFTTALKTVPDVGWYLQRAQAQRRLAVGDDDAAASLDGLRRGWNETGSPVLLRALCDALIEAGERHDDGATKEATAIIERELRDNRFVAAWLVRRARVNTIRGDLAAAEVDLRAALAELAARVDVPRPDPSLLDERAEVWRMLGDAAAADADIAAAESARARLAAEARTIAPHVHVRRAVQVEP